MAIKIEGDGSKENVFSDSESGMPLWNGAPFGLLPPDLSKARFVSLSGPGNPSRNPFIVPEDGWIVDVSSSNFSVTITIDGISNNTPCEIAIGTLVNNRPAYFVKSIPYPVRKGQAISIVEVDNLSGLEFAPCMSV